MSFLKDPLDEPAHAAEADRDLTELIWPDTQARREPQFAPVGESREAELVELVDRFERLYTELTPAPESRSESRPCGDLVVELPDDAPAAEMSCHAIFSDTAAAHANAPRVTVDENPSAAALTPNDPVPRGHTESAQPALRDMASEENEDWSTNARRALWPRLVIAGAIALAVGAGAGYIAGKTRGSIAPAAKIQATPDGGARLRFDYELHRR